MHRTDHKIRQGKIQQITERQNGMYGAMATIKPSEKAREIFNRPPFGSRYIGDDKK